jgi:6-phosphogluconolactonase/glucosamine-6-phosphate isomerase/deaminase
MQFIRRDAAAGIQELSTHLTQLLVEEKRVLWLVPGGSNIPFAVQAMTGIPDELTKRLTIILTDERYGPVGHADSNVQQLHDAGFDPKHANFIPVLDGGTLGATARKYDTIAGKQFAESDVAVGQFGIGTDGHIAGILPRSPGTTALGELAVGYEAPDFTRITLTFPALRYIEMAYVFVYGDSKRVTLEQLHNEDLPLATQPAQILKAIPEAYVYNDQVE